MITTKFFLIGGAEDRKDKKVILKKLVELSNGSILFIPNASDSPSDSIDTYKRFFNDFKLIDFDSIDIRNKKEAESKDVLEKIKKTNCIFFGGGDQSKLADILVGTNTLEVIRERVNKGTLMIAGTSAGSAVVCDPIFFDGDDDFFEEGRIKKQKGFGLIEETLIDTHFIQRNRIPRLVQACIETKTKYGIGIDENTAIIINSLDFADIVGEGVATLINNRNNSIEKIQISFLKEQKNFDLNWWKSI